MLYVLLSSKFGVFWNLYKLSEEEILAVSFKLFETYPEG